VYAIVLGSQNLIMAEADKALFLCPTVRRLALGIAERKRLLMVKHVNSGLLCMLSETVVVRKIHFSAVNILAWCSILACLL